MIEGGNYTPKIINLINYPYSSENKSRSVLYPCYVSLVSHHIILRYCRYSALFRLRSYHVKGGPFSFNF